MTKTKRVRVCPYCNREFGAFLRLPHHMNASKDDKGNVLGYVRCKGTDQKPEIWEVED